MARLLAFREAGDAVAAATTAATSQKVQIIAVPFRQAKAVACAEQLRADLAAAKEGEAHAEVKTCLRPGRRTAT